MSTNSFPLSDNESPPEYLQRKLILREHELTVLPAVASEALEMTKDSDCSMQDFVALVEKDPMLAMDVLSLANSAMFSGENAVVSLHGAIVRLGLQQVRNLIISACTKRLMNSLTLEQEWVREALWSHSFTTASACLHLNRTFNLGFQGEEFAAGLLHDFGRTLFAVICPDEFVEVDKLDFDEQGEFLHSEREAFGANHCEFGAWFAKRNNLPDELIDSIAWHHCPKRSGPHQELIALVAAADHLSNHIQRFGEAGKYIPEDNEGMLVLNDCFDASIFEQFKSVTQDIIATICTVSEAKICATKEGN